MPGSTTIHLAAALSFRLHCSTTLPPEISLAVTLLRIDPETNRPVRRAREQMLVFQTDGAVPWAPATPDRFQVALVVGRGRNKLELHESAPTRLDVRMLVAGQTIEIVPEPGALAAALAGLKD